jgi:hypothetical protein
MKTWLKGGIIALIIDIILVLFAYFSSSDGEIKSILVSIVQFPYTFLSGFATYTHGMYSITGNIVGGLIAYFIIGVIIGWIINKFRGDKN